MIRRIRVPAHINAVTFEEWHRMPTKITDDSRPFPRILFDVHLTLQGRIVELPWGETVIIERDRPAK